MLWRTVPRQFISCLPTPPSQLLREASKDLNGHTFIQVYCSRIALLFSGACALFHFAYRLTPLLATLTKTAGVYPLSSHSGTLEIIYLGAPYPCRLLCGTRAEILIPLAVNCRLEVFPRPEIPTGSELSASAPRGSLRQDARSATFLQSTLPRSPHNC